MRWSIEGQTPEFLAVTRAISLSDSIVEEILEHLDLHVGMRVLDVGCGSGEYCFRLGHHVRGVHFTGLEQDERFVDLASKRAGGQIGYPFETPDKDNSYRFCCADGCSLPFDDGSFDAVVSHTYLTAVDQWQIALREMCRVCKPGGTVSSVTSMTDDFYGTGTIELFSEPLAHDESALLARVHHAKATTFGALDLTSGIPPRIVPSAFEQAGLHHVCCTPLAQYFCLSDAATSPADYRRHIDLLRAMELEELDRLGSVLQQSDRRRYIQLIDKRCAELLAQEGDNHEWNWYGNTSLLVCGTVSSR